MRGKATRSFGLPQRRAMARHAFKRIYFAGDARLERDPDPMLSLVPEAFRHAFGEDRGLLDLWAHT
jgi:hypothetical protein